LRAKGVIIYDDDGLPKNAIEFEIYDTGIGISDNSISKLFKMFGKLDDPN
jgi:signal transduction histidine kinase